MKKVLFSHEHTGSNTKDCCINTDVIELEIPDNLWKFLLEETDIFGLQAPGNIIYYPCNSEDECAALNWLSFCLENYRNKYVLGFLDTSIVYFNG